MFKNRRIVFLFLAFFSVSVCFLPFLFAPGVYAVADGVSYTMDDLSGWYWFNYDATSTFFESGECPYVFRKGFSDGEFAYFRLGLTDIGFPSMKKTRIKVKFPSVSLSSGTISSVEYRFDITGENFEFNDNSCYLSFLSDGSYRLSDYNFISENYSFVVTYDNSGAFDGFELTGFFDDVIKELRLDVSVYPYLQSDAQLQIMFAPYAISIEELDLDISGPAYTGIRGAQTPVWIEKLDPLSVPNFKVGSDPVTFKAKAYTNDGSTIYYKWRLTGQYWNDGGIIPAVETEYLASSNGSTFRFSPSEQGIYSLTCFAYSVLCVDSEHTLTSQLNTCSITLIVTERESDPVPDTIKPPYEGWEDDMCDSQGYGKNCPGFCG